MQPADQHFQRLQRLLFAGGGPRAPAWLKDCVRDCQARYAGIALTEQFKAAVNAFDDADGPKPFELFVVGEGKFGKSTIVNCLLGEEQSKVRGLPETRCFLRYVVTNSPSTKARVYLRAQRGVHDWLLRRVGSGRSVKELYEILEHTVDYHTAREILDEEIKRLDSGNYEPAIYELERDVKRTPRTAFRNDIRVVDTQGLDQLFPDDLKRSTQGLADETTTERFINWMNNSPRGKHLEWQFRRCDAVLWCVNAKRIGSASTAASLRYFGNYSKKIVIALTNIDVAARNDAERLRVLDAASRKYSPFANRIVPVNGMMAWSGVAKGDDRSVEVSGFRDLVSVLREICEIEGLKVRNMSRYSGLRHTETQYRRALRALADDYRELHKKYDADKDQIARSLERDWGTVSSSIVTTAHALSRSVLTRVSSIEYRDERPTVDEKLGIQAEVARLSSYMIEQLSRRIVPNVADLAQATTPYRLPAFDADGMRAGNKFAIAVEPRALAVSLDIPNFRFQLGDWFDNAVDWVDEKLGFVIRGQDASNQRRAQRLRKRLDHIADVFGTEWHRYVEGSLEKVKAETIRQYQTLFDAIYLVFQRIEGHSGGAVAASEQGIRTALEKMAVPPVFPAQILASVMAVRSGRTPRPPGQGPVAPPTRATERVTTRPHLKPMPRLAAAGLEPQVGARVTHHRLGAGVIVNRKGRYYVVKFEDSPSPKEFELNSLRDPKYFLQDG